MVKEYDSRCYDLAEIFLRDEPKLATETNTRELAKAIQQAVEDFFWALSQRHPIPNEIDNDEEG